MLLLLYLVLEIKIYDFKISKSIYSPQFVPKSKENAFRYLITIK